MTPTEALHALQRNTLALELKYRKLADAELQNYNMLGALRFFAKAEAFQTAYLGISEMINELATNRKRKK